MPPTAPQAELGSQSPRPRPFDLLPRPSELSRAVVWTNMRELNLAEPIERYLERDQFLMPGTSEREQYHGDRHFDHWLSGLSDFLCISRLLAELGQPLHAGSRVLDLGCAAGRTTRHFLAQGNDLDVWCVDVNRRHVDFCQAVYGPRLKAIVGDQAPHLPMEDRFFDLVYAFSVFTHIDEWETAWLAELRRVLKPGGVAYLTIHSDQGWLNMGPKFPIFNGLMQLRDLMPEYGISEEMFKSPMPEPRLVFKMGRQPGHGCNVFHSHAYVHDVWGRYFDVVRIVENPLDPQAGVLLRRPEC